MTTLTKTKEKGFQRESPSWWGRCENDREGMVARAESWLVTLPLPSGNNQITARGTKLQKPQSPPLVMYFFQQALPPKAPTITLDSTIKWRPIIQTHHKPTGDISYSYHNMRDSVSP